jgi:hypothetical protein
MVVSPQWMTQELRVMPTTAPAIVQVRASRTPIEKAGVLSAGLSA